MRPESAMNHGSSVPVPSIWIVQDPGITESAVRATLDAEGFQVSVVEQPVPLQDSMPDLVVIEVAGQALNAVADLRDRTTAPIIVVSKYSDEATIVQALDLGADDYVCKPFRRAELLARTRALLRRARPAVTRPTIRLADLEIDFRRHRVLRAGQLIHLTKKEFDILVCLAEFPGAVLSPEKILARVWGSQYIHYVQTLRVHIGNIRNKVESSTPRTEFIRTVPGVGYGLWEQPIALKSRSSCA